MRYAWADNPEGANLYNIEGLPASPFEAVSVGNFTGSFNIVSVGVFQIPGVIKMPAHYWGADNRG